MWILCGFNGARECTEFCGPRCEARESRAVYIKAAQVPGDFWLPRKSIAKSGANVVCYDFSRVSYFFSSCRFFSNRRNFESANCDQNMQTPSHGKPTFFFFFAPQHVAKIINAGNKTLLFPQGAFSLVSVPFLRKLRFKNFPDSAYTVKISYLFY